MKSVGLKAVTWYAIIGLLIAVALLPILKASSPEYFPTLDGFRDVDCKGVSCGEGEFCQNNKCRNVATRYAGSVPEGNE